MSHRAQKILQAMLLASTALLVARGAVADGKLSEPAAPKWKPFVTPSRILSVEFPDEPSERKEKSRISELYEVDIVSRFVRTDDGATFTLTTVEVPTDTRAIFEPSDYLREAAPGAAKGLRLPAESVAPSMFAGLSAIQLTGINSVGMRVEQQMFVLDRFQVGLGVFWPDGKQRPRVADRFFASFKILDKGTWDLSPDTVQSPWLRQAPAEAGFTIEVPGASSVTPIGSGKSAGVGLVATDGLGNVYRVMELPRPPKSRCEELVLLHKALEIEIQTQKRTRFAGVDGLSVIGKRRGMLAEARVACTGQRIFLAMVTSPPRRPGHADAARFFGSMTVGQVRK